jgi:hypothetical protein
MSKLINCFFITILIISLSGCYNNLDKGNISLDEAAVTTDINTFLDNWHRAAAQADDSVFFGSMADSSIYIGTDASERWTKKQFVAFAQPYFDRGTAWDFKPYDRDIHLTEDGEHAWFSELLTTWMGVCRGSGILTRTSGGWKIDQYHLSVTVPNDAIRDFITLVNEFNNTRKAADPKP